MSLTYFSENCTLDELRLPKFSEVSNPKEVLDNFTNWPINVLSQTKVSSAKIRISSDYSNT